MLGRVRQTSIQYTHHSGPILFIYTDFFNFRLDYRDGTALLFQMQIDEVKEIFKGYPYVIKYI